MNIRFSQITTVRNSFSHVNLASGTFGPEERTSGRPISTNQDFDCLITAKEDKFEIKFNDKHFADYKYRMPLEMVRYLEVSGSIGARKITKEGNGVKCK